MEQQNDGFLYIALVIGFMLFAMLVAASVTFFTFIYQKYIPGFTI